MDLAEKARTMAEIDALCSPATPHSNCANAFVDLWKANPIKAKEMLAVVKDYLKRFGQK
ncbi:MAG TPA: hypothetical protein VGO11_13010 [Chthoniobacteraceae bacterium]|nr:hypothetical protein [Chthoniobacteraceae bacterium]